jgi:transposase
MSREAHVRIWERVGVRFPRATRHLLTDTNGLLVSAIVHAANIQDRDGAPALLASIRKTLPWLRHVFADGGYAGPKLETALAQIGTWSLEIIKRSDTAKGFELLPRRWVVERTIAWLNRKRASPRTSKRPSKAPLRGS